MFVINYFANCELIFQVQFRMASDGREGADDNIAGKGAIVMNLRDEENNSGKDNTSDDVIGFNLYIYLLIFLISKLIVIHFIF